MKYFFKFIIVLGFYVLGFSFLRASCQPGFRVVDSGFVLNGRPVVIHSGEMHYARVPRPYWRQRLRMLKAMGLNCVATYVFWNFHHPRPDVWDFKTGNHNLSAFLRIAQEEGMMVILRPGPYACAEWEYGGYPWWFQKDRGLVVRSYSKAFLDSCKIYFQKLFKQVASYQADHGGPVIMVQVENEYGSYVQQRPDIPDSVHRLYLNAILKMIRGCGFSVPLFTSDATSCFSGGALQGVLPAANGEGNPKTLIDSVNKYHDGKGPYMVAEYYPGWLDHWKEPFSHISDTEVTQQLLIYLKNRINFNIYMAHGGTNWGFTSGANYSDKVPIEPDLTSYDYDAPINEAGQTTPKFWAIRRLMQQFSSDPIAPVPAPIATIAIPQIVLHPQAGLLGAKKMLHSSVSDSLMTFEDLSQGYGYVLYSHRFSSKFSGMLNLSGLRDYATVYINGRYIGVLNRMDKKYSLPVVVPEGSLIDILVENMGRINYGAQIPENKKGLIAPVLINGKPLEGPWTMYRLPLDHQPEFHNDVMSDGTPVFYKGTFNLSRIGDTFLDMRNWGKGVVFVNGKNLGRYWYVGPQQTLYLPGCYLKKGKNEIVIFEQLNHQVPRYISSLKVPVLTSLRKEK